MKTFKLKLKDQDNNVTVKTVKIDNAEIENVALDLMKTRIYKEVRYGKGN